MASLLFISAVTPLLFMLSVWVVVRMARVYFARRPLSDHEVASWHYALSERVKPLHGSVSLRDIREEQRRLSHASGGRPYAFPKMTRDVGVPNGELQEDLWNRRN